MSNTPDTANAATAALPPAPGSVSYALFEHMDREHGLTLIGSELDEIIRVVNTALEERLRWWNTYAEREREMLIGFREAVRRIAAKPIDSSDMMDEIEHLLSLLPNIAGQRRPGGSAEGRSL